MRQWLTTTLLAVLLAGCWPSAPDEMETEIEDRDRLDVTIELTVDGLIFNGKHLNLDAPIGGWVEVLGPARDSSIGDILVWDQLGIRAYPRTFRDDRVESVAITLRREPGPTYSTPPKPGEGLEPLDLYTGRLIWKGAYFDKHTTIQELGAKVRTMIHCVKGTGGCFATGLPGDVVPPSFTAFQSDSRLYYSPIYEVSVGRRNSYRIDR
jgi:hypothetical protein